MVAKGIPISLLNFKIRRFAPINQIVLLGLFWAYLKTSLWWASIFLKTWFRSGLFTQLILQRDPVAHAKPFKIPGVVNSINIIISDHKWIMKIIKTLSQPNSIQGKPFHSHEAKPLKLNFQTKTSSLRGGRFQMLFSQPWRTSQEMHSSEIFENREVRYSPFISFLTLRTFQVKLMIF